MELSENKKQKMNKVHMEYLDAETSHPLLTKIITLCGVIFVVLLSTILFDMMYEFTLFNAIFNKTDYQNAMAVWSYGTIIENTSGELFYLELFDNVGWFGPSPSGLICFVFTVLFLIALWLVIYVIMVYVKLYALVIKGLIDTFRISTIKTTNEIKLNLKESGEIIGIDKLPIKKINKTDKSSNSIDSTQPKVKRKKTTKSQDVEAADGLSHDELDALLTSPDIHVTNEAEETTKENNTGSFLD